MTHKIKAIIRREQQANLTINQEIELMMVDEDNDHEQYIATIKVDEFEIDNEFIKMLYEYICRHEAEQKQEM